MNKQERIKFYEEENELLKVLLTQCERRGWPISGIVSHMSVNEQLIQMLSNRTVYLVKGHSSGTYLSENSPSVIEKMCDECKDRDKIMMEFSKHEAVKTILEVHHQEQSSPLSFITAKELTRLCLNNGYINNTEYDELMKQMNIQP